MRYADLDSPPLLIERTISGAGGGKGAGKQAEEAPNNLRSKQTARVVDLISEGPIKGVVGGAKGVYLDGVVVRRADNSWNFSNASLQFVNGYPNQAVMSGFNAQENEIAVSAQLKYGFPVTRAITNTDTDRTRITVSVPTLQWIDKSNGNIYGTNVQFRVQYSNNGGGWVTAGTYTISGKTTSRYQRAYIFTLPRPGPWEIRLQRLTADSKTQDLMNDLYWDSYTTIVDDKINYSNSACVGIVIDAEQFSSIPKRVYDVEGLLIRYPANMNPVNGTYTGTWNGVSFAFGWCNNPSWVLYDLITNNRYGIGDYIPASAVDPWSFYKAGVWCDARVPNGRGGTERRYICNIRITNRQEAFDLLQQMSSIFRGFTYWSGGKMILVADQPDDPEDLFTNANVVDGVFNYSGTDYRQRHTQVTSAWSDPDNLGETRLAVVEDQPAISRYGVLQLAETAYGATTESQAIRAAKWTIYSEQYEDDSIQFKTGLQGAFLRPGQIITVMDANVAGKRHGGRIGAGSTQSHIVFDAPVHVTAGQSYQLSMAIVSGDTTTVQSRSFTAATTGTIPSVTLPSGFASPPLPDQIFILTTVTLQATLWRLITTKQTERDEYEVTGVRHYPQKWDYVERNIAFSEPDISDIVAKPPAVTNAKVIEYILQTSAISLQVMATFSWTSAMPLFDVFWRNVSADENWSHQRIDQNAINLPVTAGTYTFQVTPISSIGIKGPVTSITQVIVGLTEPPATPANIKVNVNEGIALFTWDAATEIDMKVGGHYELRFQPSTTGATWNTAQQVLPSIPGTATSVEVTYQAGTWMLRAFDIEGRPSTAWASVVSLAADLRYIEFFRICENPGWTGTHQGTEVMMPQDWLVMGATGGLWDDQTLNMSTWPDVDVLGGIPANGTFDSAAGWTLDAGVTISGGAVHWSAGGGASISQAVDLEAGADYRIDFTVSGYVSGSVTPKLLGGTLPIEGTPAMDNGTFSMPLAADVDTTTFALVGDTATTELSVDNVTITALGAGKKRGLYTFYRTIDAGGVFSVRFAADVLAFPFYSEGGTIDERAGLVDDWQSWDDSGTDLDGTVTVMIGTTMDDPASATAVWSPYERFVPGEYYGRAWRFQALLEAPDTQNIGVETLCITGDFRNKIDGGEDVLYATVETRVWFRIKFYNMPAVVITIQLAMAEDRIEIVHKTREYFDLKITMTSSGTNPIGARTFDWHAQGY